jgi:hypothetical protein
MIFFDIETGPLGSAELKSRMPVFEPRRGLKDPVKITADIEGKRTSWNEKATLNAFTSKVWSIGYGVDDEAIEIDHHGADPAAEMESQMLERFFALANDGAHQICGFNIFGFDIPFIMRRAYSLGVKVPPALRHRKFWHDRFIDIMDCWVLGTFRSEPQNRISLGNLAKHLGLEGKTGHGSQFWQTYITDQASALEYAERDVELLREIWAKIGN